MKEIINKNKTKMSRFMSAFLLVSILSGYVPTTLFAAEPISPVCEVEFVSEVANHSVQLMDTVDNILRTDVTVSPAHMYTVEDPQWNWTNIADATWIWSSYEVEKPRATTTVFFNRSITASSIKSATLTIAADNAYNVKINGMNFATSPMPLSDFYAIAENFSQPHIHEIPASYFVSGSNQFSFDVTNIAIESDLNPAGLIYKLKLVGTDIVGGKVISCEPVVNPINTPPTITLIGANPLEITVGTLFTDPGATANDAEDGNITSSIVKTGTVNASTTGSYVLNYSVADSKGLTATTSRTVVVKPAGCTSNCGGGGNPIPVTQCTLVSDTNTQVVGGSNAVLAYTVPNWSAVIPGASWIWSTYKVANPTATTTVTFEKSFNATTTPTTAVLTVAADNMFEVRVNNVLIDSTTGVVNFGSGNERTYNVASHIKIGANKITFKVTNTTYAEGTTPETNPAGLLYSFNMTGAGCVTTTVTPNTPPTITLIGANPLEITVGTLFTDPGATANDAEDGNITSSIVKTGTVNASTTGSYVLNYSVADSKGLTATTSRTVVVKPAGCTSNCGGGGNTNTPPTITLIGNNPIIINLGNDFTDPGATANDAEDGNLTSKILRTGTVSTTTVSTSTLTYSVHDSKGLGATTTRTVIIVPANAVIKPICSDGLDNDTDGKIDAKDPGCHTDNDPNNPNSYNPEDGDESDAVVTPPGGGGGGTSGGRSGGRRTVVTGEILGATSCSYLRDYLKKDWNNDPVEMLKLKSFLNVFEKENLSLTTEFDQPTYEAVSRFQNKYESDILTPWGHTEPTGFVYILTKKKINEIFCNTILSLSQDDSKEIEAFRNMLKSNNSILNIDTGMIGYNTVVKPDVVSDIKDNELQFVFEDSQKGSEEVVVELKDTNNNMSFKDAAISFFAFSGKGQNMCSLNSDTKCIVVFFVLLAIISLISYLIGGMERFASKKRLMRIRTFFIGNLLVIVLALITSTYCLVWPFVVTLIVSLIVRYFMDNEHDKDSFEHIYPGIVENEEVPLPKEEKKIGSGLISQHEIIIEDPQDIIERQ